MHKHTSTLSIAAILAASALVLQAPVASAADNANSNNTTQSSSTQNGMPGVDIDVGRNASDRGLPGVEMNVGKDGGQQNMNSSDTRTLGAGSDNASTMQDSSQSQRPLRADRN